MLSENTVTTDTVAPEGAPESVTPPGSLFELLDDIEPAPVEPTPPEGTSEQEPSPKSDPATKPGIARPALFNDLAEATGLELNDLYALKVTTKDGQTVTIEELKALHATQDDIVIRELEIEETRATENAKLRQAQTELSDIVNALPEGSLQPAMLEKLRAKNTQRVVQEQQRTLDAIPEWADETARTADMVGMAQHLEGFGYPADYIGTIVDHRQLVFVRASYQREQRIKAALSRVRAAAPNPTTPTKSANGAPTKTSAPRKHADSRNGLESFFSDLN